MSVSRIAASRTGILFLVALFVLAIWPTGGISIGQESTTWTPPPPEFADLSQHAPLARPVMKWEPSLGEPTSLLDVLPVGSPAVADYNGDYYLDIFIPSTQYTDDALNDLREPRSRLYMNDESVFGGGSERDEMRGLSGGEERFIDVTESAGIDVEGHAYSASWGDVNGDGAPDLFVGGYEMARLFLNNQDGTFTEVTETAGLPQGGLVLGGAWGDYDLDGHLDLLLVQFADYEHPEDGLPSLTELDGRSNVLLKNNGDSTFTDVTDPVGLDTVARRSTSGVFVDADQDGLLDLFVTNYGEGAELWVNGGDGTFTENAQAAGLAFDGEATCQAWEDFDRDGTLDLFIGNRAGRSALLLGNGDGTYTDAGNTPGLEATDVGDAWGCVAFDYDNDGDMDLYLARSGLQGDDMRKQGRLLMNLVNDGDPLAFEDVTDLSGQRTVPGFLPLDRLSGEYAASGVAAFDWIGENKGLMVTTNDGDMVRIFRNLKWQEWAGSGNFFQVTLEGRQSNSMGLGAVVTVDAGIFEITRQAGTSMSWGGQSLQPLQFNFAKDDDGERGYRGVAHPISVRIDWPSGQVDVYEDAFRMRTQAHFTEAEGYRLDTKAPPTDIVLDDGAAGKNTWYTSDAVTLHLTAWEKQTGSQSGIKSMHVSTDGTNWAEVENPGDWQLPERGTYRTFEGEGTHPLWIETEDHAGNSAIRFYPVRIDTQAPEGEVVDPAPGGVYVQNQKIQDLGAHGVERSVVVVAQATPDWPQDTTLGDEAPGPLGNGFGTGNRFPVKAQAEDATSGTWKVDYRLVKSNGHVPDGHEANRLLAPYTWEWAANETPAGQWRLETRVTDIAGHETTIDHGVLVVPTGLEGILKTVEDNPSFPSLP